MKFTNKDLYALLFTELSPNQARCNTFLKLWTTSIAKHDIAHFLLTEEESTQAKEHLETLFNFQEVSKALQDPMLTLVGG
ncbi:hypothetical protein PI124_g20507 [Phytophthora idaei]|nr:hypothetical protein PI124_g20507 [Phytophthora idaei]